ncbi:integrase catalytic domain-containing protein [Trichonephila clavipes]|nr:integrase catalytic domain-containing protein [Trichonephila clavipes]
MILQFSGHFLIGTPLQSLLHPDLTDKLDNCLPHQFIWLKWRLSYLNNLQAKWQFEKENVTPNSMDILKEENLPPCKVTMERILEIVKGSDEMVRVVTVKTTQEKLDNCLYYDKKLLTQKNIFAFRVTLNLLVAKYGNGT